ncbi:hypothetical protein [Desulfoluna butyratoxydans]|uniref:hypothetical protein n=1 Tax=Desulfoluna butyratoxydans TaxID=231438 RepID=UPI0015D3EC7C|nr:hypothetical protein [Desulfoluna butyratoxydans]
MEYKVRIVLTIMSLDKKRWAGGYIDTTLPFVPFIGLSLWGEVGARWQTKPIESISYNIEDQRFHCSTQEHEFESDDGDFVDIDFLIRSAKKHGWKGFEEIYENPS